MRFPEMRIRRTGSRPAHGQRLILADFEGTAEVRSRRLHYVNQAAPSIRNLFCDLGRMGEMPMQLKCRDA